MRYSSGGPFSVYPLKIRGKKTMALGLAQFRRRALESTNGIASTFGVRIVAGEHIQISIRFTNELRNIFKWIGRKGHLFRYLL